MAECPEMDGPRQCELGYGHIGPHFARCTFGTVKWPVDPPNKVAQPEGETK